MRRAWLAVLCACLPPNVGGCDGADPEWDLYPLESWYLADLPRPVLVAEVVGQGAERALQVRVDAGLPCPIPLATAVTARAGDRPMVAVPGDKRGNGIGLSCRNPTFRIPASELGAPRRLDVTLTDGRTTWVLGLAAPADARTVVPEAAAVAPGGPVRVRVTPPEDRWIADPAGAMPSMLLLTSREPDVARRCTREHAQLLPAEPGDVLELTVPSGFCAGPAFVGLSASTRRQGVTACPTGVACRFETSGFVAPVDVGPVAAGPAR